MKKNKPYGAAAALLAGALLGGLMTAPGAHAVDFRVKGVWIAMLEYGDGGSFVRKDREGKNVQGWGRWGEDRFEAVSRDELSVEIFTGEFPHLLASICRQAILGNEPLEATPETAAQYGFSPEEMNTLGAQIARCNRRIIAELREDYERLKAIDCLHS